MSLGLLPATQFSSCLLLAPFPIDSRDVLQFLQLPGEHKKADDSQSGDLCTDTNATADADTDTDTYTCADADIFKVTDTCAVADGNTDT